MKKMSIVEIMKYEVCHVNKSNCEICPVYNACKDGVLAELINETLPNDKYTLDIFEFEE